MASAGACVTAIPGMSLRSVDWKLIETNITNSGLWSAITKPLNRRGE